MRVDNAEDDAHVADARLRRDVPLVLLVEARLAVRHVDRRALQLDARDAAGEVRRIRVLLGRADARHLARAQAERAEAHVRRALRPRRELQRTGVVVAGLLELGRVDRLPAPDLRVGVGLRRRDAAAGVLLLLRPAILLPLVHFDLAGERDRRLGDAELLVRKDVLRVGLPGHVDEPAVHLRIDLRAGLNAYARAFALVQSLRRLHRVALVPEEHGEAQHEEAEPHDHALDRVAEARTPRFRRRFRYCHSLPPIVYAYLSFTSGYRAGWTPMPFSAPASGVV